MYLSFFLGLLLIHRGILFGSSHGSSGIESEVPMEKNMLSNISFYLFDAVFSNIRSSAVSDTYANQSARAGSILPFTSALAGLCAAVT